MAYAPLLSEKCDVRVSLNEVRREKPGCKRKVIPRDFRCGIAICCCLQRITTTCECLWFKNMELLYPDPDTIASTRCDSHLLHGAVDEVGASVREGN